MTRSDYALVLSIGILSYEASDADAADGVRAGTAATPDRALWRRAYSGTLARGCGRTCATEWSGLFDAEALRYFAIIDSAGIPAEAAEAELLDAGYALEAAR